MEGQMTFLNLLNARRLRDTRNLDGRESVLMNLHSIILLNFVKDMARKPMAG